MKKFISITSLLIILSLSISIAQDFHNRTMTIRMNGHALPPVHDFISDTIASIFSSVHDEIVNGIKQHIKDDLHGGNISVAIPNEPCQIIFSNNQFKIIIGNFFLGGCWVGFDLGCRFDAYFNIVITGNIQTDNTTITHKVSVSNVQASVEQLSVNGYLDMPWYVWLAGGWIPDALCNIVSGWLGDYQFTNSFRQKLTNDITFDIYNPSQMNPGLASGLTTEILNSFPVGFAFSGDANNDLVLDINFMQGTETNPTQFVGTDPGAPTNSTFNYLGFGCPYSKFQKAFDDWQTNKPDGPSSEYYSTVLSSMKNYSAQSVRVSFPWRDIFGDGKIPITLGHTVSQLTPTELKKQIDTIPNSYWAGMDSIMARSYRLGFDVIPQLLQQESDQPLKDGGTIVPDSTKRGYFRIPAPNGWPYQFVDGETYLYYAKIFANAVVRRYRNDVGIWALESELNAKRILVMYDWMQGNLFKDESSGGFQDRLWSILVDAVKQNDPSAKIMTNFHMLNLVKGIQRFGSNLDIIGVDVYPNVVFAEPVLGSAVGEVVWATRRVLKGLNWDQKVVHVAETAYPGIVNNPNVDPPSGMGINDRMKWFSYGRQAKYMQDAIQSSLDKGAQGFFWWGFLDKDSSDSNSKDGYLNYGSLIVRNTKPLQFKNAAIAFQGKVATTHPGKSLVTLTNRSVASPTGNLGGFLAVAAERDSVVSGNSKYPIYVTKNWNHISQTYQQFMQGLKHQSWNQNSPEFYLKQNFNPLLASTPRSALFAPTQPANFNLTVEGIIQSNVTLSYKDPWYVDGSGNQPNMFRSISLAPSFSDNVFPSRTITSGTYYSVSVPQTLNFGGAIGVRNVFLQSWRATPKTSASFQDSLASQTGVVFNTSGATVTANVKGSMLSSTATAFSNNSQRKFVRTKDGWLHQVYESMNRVWLEHSTNNGTTWFLGNDGQPLDNGAGKCPSIDWHYCATAPNNPDYNAFVVVFQQPYNATYTIAYINFYYYNGSYVHNSTIPSNPSTITVPSGPNMGFLYTEPSGGDTYSTTNANPTIAWGASDGQQYSFVVTFERKSTAGGRQPGIYWMYGYMAERWGLQSPQGATTPFTSNPTKIDGTSEISTNASIALNKEQGVDANIFDIVYQTDPSFNSNIMHMVYFCDFNGSNFVSSLQHWSLISNGSGFLNYKPSMVQMPDNSIRVCWIRDMYGSGSGAPNYVNAVYWKSTAQSVFNYYGNMVNSVSLNIKDSSSNTYFAYAQKTNNSAWQNFVSNGSSTVSLSTTGQYIQLSNGPSSSAMYASSYYTASLPYYFQNSSPSGLSKSASNEYTCGRGISLNGLGFFYSLKSLTVDKSNIRFAEIPERNEATTRRRGTPSIPLDSLNTMLISEPFTVGEGTSFTFSDDGGFTDSSAVKEVLGKRGYICCKLELIDDATGKTVGVMKESKFSLSRSFRDNLSASRMNLKGMGTKKVRVKMTVSSNVDSLNGVWVNEYGTMDDNTLAKIAKDEITLQSPEIIKEYALEQNFPNPFNPSTTIRYQLPNAGHVTLKVYDMLGREVATLVDEMKEVGSYTATFDGARLASGTYIARLTAQSEEGKSFVQIKKMVMLK